MQYSSLVENDQFGEIKEPVIENIQEIQDNSDKLVAKSNFTYNIKKSAALKKFAGLKKRYQLT